MLKVEHITKDFGAYRALDDVSIAVRRGSIFGLLGPNGAGKTTLIRIINHITQADSGSVTLNGIKMSDDVTRMIGYMPEERGLYKKMRVGEQALYLAQLKGMDRRQAETRLKEWFERFEIQSWWNRKVEDLSKGMQQKVQFIITVVHEPSLLIFDEPFSGFDPINATLLKNEILRLRDNGATVIFSTHNMPSVEEICDDIALINKSKVVLNGSVKEIRTAYGQNRYHIEGVLTQEKIRLPGTYIVENETHSDTFSADIRIPKGESTNELISILLPQCQIRQIKELLPSMNDIFISCVQNQ